MNKVIAKPYWLLVIVICAAIVVTAKAYKTDAAASAAPQTSLEVSNLDRRLSTLEQRLYAIESSISRLEQQALTSGRSTSIPSPTLRDPEVNQLLSEVETLKLRVRELECGVVHLDERTLAAGAKETQRRAGTQSKDPCRQSAETSVRLSMRP
jgi:predicted  nucleic acid-binding Zn-ribbon protein